MLFTFWCTMYVGNTSGLAHHVGIQGKLHETVSITQHDIEIKQWKYFESPGGGGMLCGNGLI